MMLVLRSKRFSKLFSAGLNSFIQEARLLACFNHPSLLHVLRFWVQNDTAYIGTLFYSGTTLSHLQEQQPELIDEMWIRQMLPVLLGAIKTIHDAGFLHRDISPDNIQIQENGQPVLLDFGSARRTIGNLSDETETMLRPGYAPVEQYTDNNESEQGAWTDIYAVGAVLHKLIVGSPPPVSVVRSIQDTYQLLAELKPAGYSLPLLLAVDKALALRIEDRPHTVEDFAELIEIPVFNIGNKLPMKKTGTMLSQIENEAVPPSPYNRQRFKVSVLIASGVLVGIIAGKLIPIDNGSNLLPAGNAYVQSQSSETLSTALVYVRMQVGEKLKLNGIPYNTQPTTNGVASLKLAPGHYEIVLQGNGQRRVQVLDIMKPGTWLINPSR
ncbi:Serine/threonine-protein kinase pknB [Citrobacter freundii]|nr:Serine/threonine-protein kinase pknB [Citrobacter freundii]